MTFRTWFVSTFCLRGILPDSEEKLKEEHKPVEKAKPFASPESALFHKSVVEFESLQYKSADLKTREDSQREREITGFIIRRSHGRIIAQKVQEEKVWEHEAQVQDQNKIWAKAKAHAQAQAHDEGMHHVQVQREKKEIEKEQEQARVSFFEKSCELARQKDWDHADSDHPIFEERPTRQSRRSVGSSRLNIETHLSPRKHHKKKHRRHSHSKQHPVRSS